jgi:uroporphyrinogen-III synthase
VSGRGERVGRPGEKGRLAGRTIVITRTAGQASPLRTKLEAEGAAVVAVPTIAVVSDEGTDALAGALAEVWDWVVVTSPNGVASLTAASAPALSHQRIAVVGPGTADALRGAGAEPGLVAPRAVAEGLLEAFPTGPGRVLLVQGDRARPVLADGLRAAGWDVRHLVAYRTVDRPVSAEEASAARAADAIAFTSASTVESWVASAGVAALPAVVVSIGPVTTAAAQRLGVGVHATAEPHTLDGLVDAIVAALNR